MLKNDDFEPVKAYVSMKTGFESLVGHNMQLDYLKNLITDHKIPHGFIFEGSDGIGKFTVARTYARMLLCANSDVDPGCGRCSSCHKFDTFNHPDYLVVDREGTSQNILVSQMSDIQEFIQVRPNENGRKIIIVRDAENMNAAAQNKILKILEEPPSYAIIIFTVNNGLSLLATVISRCQKVSFFRLSGDDLVDIAERLKTVDLEKTKSLINFAQGSAGQLIKLMDSDKYVNMRNVAVEIPGFLKNRDFVKSSQAMSGFGTNREEALNFLRMLLIVYRDILAVCSGRKMEKTLYNSDKKSELIDYSISFDNAKAVQSIVKIEEAFEYLNANVSPLLVFDNLVIKLQEVYNG